MSGLSDKTLYDKIVELEEKLRKKDAILTNTQQKIRGLEATIDNEREHYNNETQRRAHEALNEFNRFSPNDLKTMSSLSSTLIYLEERSKSVQLTPTISAYYDNFFKRIFLILKTEDGDKYSYNGHDIAIIFRGMTAHGDTPTKPKLKYLHDWYFRKKHPVVLFANINTDSKSPRYDGDNRLVEDQPYTHKILRTIDLSLIESVFFTLYSTLLYSMTDGKIREPAQWTADMKYLRSVLDEDMVKDLEDQEHMWRNKDT